MPRFVVATLFAPVHVEDPRRLVGTGIRECSRLSFDAPLSVGAKVYVAPLAGTPYWVAFSPTGAVLKMTVDAARKYLISERHADGSPVYDDRGVGERLRVRQNRRAGDRDPQPRRERS